MVADQIRVLIADDVPAIRVLIRTLLNQILDGEVIEVGDGAAALGQALLHQPALIISDIEMPELDGYQLCHAIRNDPRTQDTPLILITGYGDRHTAEKAVESGASAYLTKPFSIAQFTSLVDNFLSNHSPSR